MVALLWFANLSAVYPLLQILFHSQNCQRWISQKVVDTRIEIETHQARLVEMDTVERLATPARPRTPEPRRAQEAGRGEC